MIRLFRASAMALPFVPNCRDGQRPASVPRPERVRNDERGSSTDGRLVGDRACFQGGRTQAFPPQAFWERSTLKRLLAGIKML